MEHRAEEEVCRDSTGDKQHHQLEKGPTPNLTRANGNQVGKGIRKILVAFKTPRTTGLEGEDSQPFGLKKTRSPRNCGSTPGSAWNHCGRVIEIHEDYHEKPKKKEPPNSTRDQRKKEDRPVTNPNKKGAQG